MASSFKKTVFKNGLTLVSERNREFRGLSIGIWVKAGTRHERPRDAGICHFLEHMLFKGTDKRDALSISLSIDQVGGDFNAFTTREYTCFHILLLADHLDLAIDILSDIIMNSRFDSEEMERERKVILQEIAMVEESPEEIAHDIYYEMVFGRGGLGRPILGTESSIKRLRRKDLLRFFREHYQPENLVVSVCGNVSHAALIRKLTPWVRRRWGKKKPATEMGPTPKFRSGTWWVRHPSEQVHLIWGLQGPSYSTSPRDRLGYYLLNTYLGGGMSSVLFQEIREKRGLAYTVYSSVSPFMDTGVFSVYAATSMSKVPLCLRLMRESVERLGSDLLPETEMDSIRENLKGSILLSNESVESRMFGIAQNEIFHGRNFDADEICRRIDQVTAVDIRRIARKLLRGNPGILALGPRPSRQVVTKLQPEVLRQRCRT